MIFRNSPQYWTALSEIKPFVASRRSNSAPSRAARAQSRRPTKCSRSVSVPRSVTRTRRSSSGENRSALLKSLQKSSDGLPALVVCRADGKAPLDLAGEFLGGCPGSLADNQEVVGLPPEALGLKVHLRDDGSRSGSAECRARAVGPTSMPQRSARKGARSPGGGGARDTSFI